MIRATSPLRARSGFTLVELMVGAAIVVLIMAVLATCFQLATDAMREMKATGDLASQLRGAETVIRRDLEVDHFLPEPGRPTGRLSDQALDKVQVTGTTLGPWKPPKAGFFRMKSTPGIFEGIDADSLTSTRATDHFLHFTAIQPDTVDSQPYTATSSNQPYKSRAAELAYFLDPAPSGTTGGSTPLNLYRLIRRQRLVALNAGYVNNYPKDEAVISTRGSGATLAVNTMADVAHPDQRLGRSRVAVPTVGNGTDDGIFAPLSTASRLGEDILLGNVISFEVRAIWTPATGATPAKLPYVRSPSTFLLGTSTDHPFDSLPPVPPPPGSPTMAVGQDPAHTQGNTLLGGQNIFDTWSQLPNWDKINAAGELTPSGDIPPLFIRVQALQIRIRVWDSSTQTTRQITIVQEM